jgi:hypothetical protein
VAVPTIVVIRDIVVVLILVAPYPVAGRHVARCYRIQLLALKGLSYDRDCTLRAVRVTHVSRVGLRVAIVWITLSLLSVTEPEFIEVGAGSMSRDAALLS